MTRHELAAQARIDREDTGAGMAILAPQMALRVLEVG